MLFHLFLEITYNNNMIFDLSNMVTNAAHPTCSVDGYLQRLNVFGYKKNLLLINSFGITILVKSYWLKCQISKRLSSEAQSV